MDMPEKFPTFPNVTKRETAELTYPLRAAARLTGLSPEVLRAWERRYGVVEPLRTPGGTRRYRASDLERLRLVKAAVDAGNRIGKVAQMDLSELEQSAASDLPTSAPGLAPLIAALERLDSDEARRLLGLQLATLGPARFAQEFASPLVREIGERWANDRLSIASEHLATSLLRSMLGSALAPTAASRLGPRIVFATPSGERHELGLQMAAITALGAGAHPVYLGAELPVEALLEAIEEVSPAAVALSLATPPSSATLRAVAALRAGVDAAVRIWVGGAAALEVGRIEGVEILEELAELERRVALLPFERPGAQTE
jgi:DNA-binding transcriptional MerR regulator